MRKYLTKLLFGAGIGIISQFLCGNFSLVNGETCYAVELSSNCEAVYGEETAVEILVTFHDRSYYNSQVYLSYHLEDKEGNTVQYENERYPLTVNENAQATVTVLLDYDSISLPTSEKELFLRFDLVDQENLFWFSQREDISFAGTTVPWSIKGVRVFFLELRDEIRSSPLIFMLNLVAFIGFAGMALYIRAKRNA